MTSQCRWIAMSKWSKLVLPTAIALELIVNFPNVEVNSVTRESTIY